MKIFVCEDSLAGIFTGVYDAWAAPGAHAEKRLITGDTWNMELFAEYAMAAPDSEKAEKVIRTLERRLGHEAYEQLCYAAMSDAIDKADVIYHTIVTAFAMRDSKRVFQNMHDPAVMRCFALGRTVGREATHHLEFIRFRELENGVLFARCTPKNRITLVLAEHFCDRFPAESFIILNATHHEAALHAAGEHTYVLCDSAVFLKETPGAYSETEELFQDLWKEYFATIAIEDRKNEKLQGQLFPKRYWKDSVELQDKA